MPQTPTKNPHPEHSNRLIHENSPYLLQHAHNPVDWYPWGDEAFEAARTAQKPILVSIGYSTCYWCHVMEREEFENPAIARLMNEYLICIKVDREERPDVDEIYMLAAQLQSGSGGWPLNVFLTPPPPADLADGQKPWKGLQPFFGGTYFPPVEKFGKPAWPDLVAGIAGAWAQEREEMIERSEQFARVIAARLAGRNAAGVDLTRTHIEQALVQLLRLFDREYGGFGSAPKFPQPVYLGFLMDVRDTAGSETTRHSIDTALSKTLDMMAMGGMYDQIGGGFHRYSTDRIWLVPHFEKMLYDNAQLAEIYAFAAESAAGDLYYQRIAEAACRYVLREMTDPQTGAFYSAQDAEVNGYEGQNYLWTPFSLTDALNRAGESDLVTFALDAYGFNEGGANFKDPHHADAEPMSILHLTRHPIRMAERHGLTVEQVYADLDRINAALLKERQTRPQPALDDKTIAGWNGLMIAGLAQTGRVLKQPEFIAAADRAWQFIDAHLRDPATGEMCRTWRAGRLGAHAAVCEDYAALAHGLLALHEATGAAKYLESAIDLMRAARRLFWNVTPDDREAGGGYFDTQADQPDLFVRSRSIYDSAIPSANGLMLSNLIAIYQRTGSQSWLDEAVSTVRANSVQISENPLGAVESLRGLHHLLSVITAQPPKPAAGDESKQQASPELPDRRGGDVVRLDAPTDPVRLRQTAANREGEVMLTGTLDISLDIPEGYHIYSHGDVPERTEENAALPLSMSMEGLDAHWSVSATYPPGLEMEVAGLKASVITGSAIIHLRLNWKGSQKDFDALRQRPSAETLPLIVSWQACNDQVCLAPQRRSRDIRIEIVDE